MSLKSPEMKGCHHKLLCSSCKQKTDPAKFMCSEEETIPYVPAYVFVVYRAGPFRETRLHFKDLGSNFLGVTAHSRPHLQEYFTCISYINTAVCIYMCVCIQRTKVYISQDKPLAKALISPGGSKPSTS